MSVSVKWLAAKTASEMTYIVSSGALNSTSINQGITQRYLPPGRGDIPALWWPCLSVWLFVCQPANISRELHARSSPSFCACYLYPWLGPRPAASRYVMHFRFCGWRHVCSCPGGSEPALATMRPMRPHRSPNLGVAKFLIRKYTYLSFVLMFHCSAIESKLCLTTSSDCFTGHCYGTAGLMVSRCFAAVQCCR